MPGTLLLMVTGMWKDGMVRSGCSARSALALSMAVNASKPPFARRSTDICKYICIYQFAVQNTDITILGWLELFHAIQSFP